MADNKIILQHHRKIASFFQDKTELIKKSIKTREDHHIELFHYIISPGYLPVLQKKIGEDLKFEKSNLSKVKVNLNKAIKAFSNKYHIEPPIQLYFVSDGDGTVGGHLACSKVRENKKNEDRKNLICLETRLPNESQIFVPLNRLGEMLEKASLEIEKEEPEDKYFSKPIQNHMASLNQKIEKLTQEQYRIIQQLRFMNRVRISGCAGSGKTLVAAEKAIRLSRAGLRTLFICHSPFLAEYVKKLTKGFGVYVVSFTTWLAELIGSSPIDISQWTNYQEPDEISLCKAFDILVEKEPYFDAVIVDEGQDFRDEWWTLVEAALKDPQKGIMYIFHDDCQALLPYRSTYPIKEPVIDLSKNCRNAGKIYEVMRYFHSQAPSPEVELKDEGRVTIVPYSIGNEQDALKEATILAHSYGTDEDIVLLLCKPQLEKEESLIDKMILVPKVQGWQGRVHYYFFDAISRITNSKINNIELPPGGSKWVSERLTLLSNNSYPNDSDIKLVSAIAHAFKIEGYIRRKIPQFREGLRWYVDNNVIKLRRSGTSSIWPYEVIMHFERNDWIKGLPEPLNVTFVSQNSIKNQRKSIPIFDIGSYKGLEANIVILLLRGYSSVLSQRLYVGVSRARYMLIIVSDEHTLSKFPDEWKEIVHTLYKV